MCNNCGQLECDCRGTDLKDTHMRRKTSKTDVYAFGCLYYEVSCSHSTSRSLGEHVQIYFDIAPFPGLGEYQIIKRVTDGERPERLERPRMADITWDLVQHCWTPNPSARPNMEDVVEQMTSKCEYGYVSARSGFLTTGILIASDLDRPRREEEERRRRMVTV